MKIMKLSLTIMLLLAVSFAGSAYGQGRGNGNGGGKGNGGGSGGGPGEETIPNNLSVPAIFVGEPLQLNFGVGEVVYPESYELNPPPFTGYSVDVEGNYYVQGIHLWQADSMFSARESQCMPSGETTSRVTPSSKQAVPFASRLDSILRMYKKT